MRPTRFFDARTCSAIPSAARTPCSIGLSVSVPMNDSRRASTTMTTSPDRSPSYSFVNRRSSRADAFQLIRRTSSPAVYSRTPQKSVPAPICREATCPNHGRVRRGWSLVRRRSSIVGATTRRASTERTASSAPKARGSSDRTRTRAGGKRDPKARTITGGSARRTSCQLRRAKPATRRPNDAAARPPERGVRISRHLRDRHSSEDVSEDRRGANPPDPRIRFQDDAVGEGGHRDHLDVVWGHEVATGDRGPRARRFEEGERASRTRADVDLTVGPRRRDDVDHVSLDRRVDLHVLDRRLQAAHLIGRRHGLNRRVVCASLPSTLEDFDLLLPRRIADIDLQQEPVDLRLGERIGAFVLDRILRRDHEERPVQWKRLALQGGLSFLHRLEQRGLGLRRRAVDLVREEDVREDRPAPEDEIARLALEDVSPGDVGREQVRCELDASEREAEACGERLRDQRLRQARDVFDQQMTVAEDRPEDALQDRALADDHGLDRVEEIAADLPDGGDVHRHASIRVRTSRNAGTKPPRARARWTQAMRSSRSPASRYRKSTSASSPNIRRSASGSRCTSRIVSGGRPRASRARSRNADRALEATRTWL